MEDEDEGFPGGPYELSLLPNFGKHVAYKLWSDKVLQVERKMTGVSHGKKLKLSALSLPLPVDDNRWFWDPVDTSGLRPLLLTGYESISHGLVCALAERWHEETSSFHLPVGEMTVTLDDVACLLDIPIVGRLIEEDDLDHCVGVELLENQLLFTVEDAMEQVSYNSGAYVTYTALKERYEQLLNRCNQLVGEDLSEEEEEEQRRVRPACVKAFLLLLLGYTLFAGKNSKTINLLWLLAIQNLDELGEWSWGGMGLAFLYEQLSLTSSSHVGSCGGYMSLLVGWVLAHFRHIVPRRKYEDYERENPYVGRWRPPRGYSDAGHFRGLMDSMEHCHVIWRPYEHRRDVTPFQDVCWYSGWIMAGKQKMVRHLPERVLRQYGYVQTVPRPPTTIVPLAPAEVATAFFEFVVHVLSQQDRGDPVPEDEWWKHSDGYIKWFYRVSHPLIVNPAPVPEYIAPRPVYQEVIVEQEWVKHPPDPLQVINNMRVRVEHAMEIPEVASNPLFFNILEGLLSDYIVFDKEPVPRRRSRSPRVQEQE
ncbi:putative protein-serine/threonine phosphatase [Medicago truncatula]|uniref:Aminotransferase-like plant mobile domain-containing protein n=2 Tax=Medicago truncatula TaxID=3880 RepID=A0A396HF17_MEDTR|nr:protein MAINTENANCE OF MERISTEMS-like isoform X3 [Medicago truncatula]RHN49885.1 putative protein-serine/threonine phosphatase [Medicago truncatula]